MKLGMSVLAVALVGSSCKPAPQRLPAMTDEYNVDGTLVLTLPDTGGYIGNGIPMDSAKLASDLQIIFAPRRKPQRAVLVHYNPHRPWRDHQLVQTLARAAGGDAFDYDLSGWPPPPMDVEVADSLD